MSFQAYLDNIKAKTGKTPDDFRALAAKKGLTQYREIMTWLQTEFNLGHGHANVVAQLLVNADIIQASPDDKLAAHFTGDKSKWRKTYDDLLVIIAGFGGDIEVSSTSTYISLLRGSKKFAILHPATAERCDLGIKLKGVAPTGRLEVAGSWNNLVTHRVRISDPKQIDAEVIAWLKQAYDNLKDKIS